MSPKPRRALLPRDSPSRPLPLEGPFAPLGKSRGVTWVLGDEGRGRTEERRGRKEARCCECPALLPNSVWASTFQAGARAVVEVGSKRQKERELEASRIRSLETWPWWREDRRPWMSLFLSVPACHIRTTG